MKIHLLDLAALLAGMVLCNFLFRAVSDQNWTQAADRSIFQAAALAAVWIMSAVNKNNNLH